MKGSSKRILRTGECLGTWRSHSSVLKILDRQIKMKKYISELSRDDFLSYLEKLVTTTDTEWYDAKHRTISIEEKELLNHIIPPDCPYCHFTNYISWGNTSDGIKRFKCKKCNKTFSPITNTLFDCHKIPISEWLEFVLHLFEFHSVKTSALDNRNMPSTGRYWLKKVFLALRNYQDEILLGRNVWLDETLFPVIKSKEILVGGKKLRGISRNKISVATATDGIHTVLIRGKTAKPTKRSTWLAYSGHILNGTHIYHDDENSHSVLMENIPNLTETIYPTKMLRGLKDKDNPMYKINHIHSLAKSFMKSHGSYDRNELQDWMNLFAFIINPPFDRRKKAVILLKLIINTRERIKTRDEKLKKHSD